MKTTKEKIATIFTDYWIGVGMYDKLEGEAKSAADSVAQEALDVVLKELESTDMQKELWNLADKDGCFLLAGKRGVKTYYPKLLLKAAADRLRG